MSDWKLQPLSAEWKFWVWAWISTECSWNIAALYQGPLDKMLIFSQAVSEVQSVLELQESLLLKVQWHRSAPSRNYNVLPQNVINFYKTIPVTWSSLTFRDLIYFSIHILSRLPEHHWFFCKATYWPFSFHL